MPAAEKTRWTITVKSETDAALRDHLGPAGRRRGEISKFVEEAVRRQMFDTRVEDWRARNADREIEAIIDEALVETRAGIVAEKAARKY